jgi:predicted esterase
LLDLIRVHPRSSTSDTTSRYVQQYPSTGSKLTVYIGFESYFGPGPHYRFFKDKGEAEASAVEGIRVFPEADSPADALRALMPKGETKVGFAEAREAALERLYEALDADPEICGVIGYSEGASAAATLIYDEQERANPEGYVPRIKVAVFFMGWPAISETGLVLSDEVENLIEVQSLHIVGANGTLIRLLTPA